MGPEVDKAVVDFNAVAQGIWQRWQALGQEFSREGWWQRLAGARQELDQLAEAKGYSAEQRRVIDAAGIFAWTAHQANNDQSARFRQHADEPYTMHLYRVAQRLVRLKLPVEAVAAGLLHDTEEDVILDLESGGQKFRLTGAGRSEKSIDANRVVVSWLDVIADQFGSETASYVAALTEPTEPEIQAINEANIIELVVGWASEEIRNFQGKIRVDEKQKIRKALAALAKILSKVLFENLSPAVLPVKTADIADNSEDYLARFQQGEKPPLAKLLRAVLGMNLAMLLGDYPTFLEISRALDPFLKPGNVKGRLTAPSAVEDQAASLASRHLREEISITVEGQPLEGCVSLDHLPLSWIHEETRLSWSRGVKPWWLGWVNLSVKPQGAINAADVWLRKQANTVTAWRQVLAAFGRDSAVFTNTQGKNLLGLFWLDSRPPTLAESLRFDSSLSGVFIPEAGLVQAPPNLNEAERQFHLTNLMLFLVHPNLPFRVGKKPVWFHSQEKGWFWFSAADNQSRLYALTGKLSGLPSRKTPSHWQNFYIQLTD
jgi:hypothetical protein